MQRVANSTVHAEMLLWTLQATFINYLFIYLFDYCKSSGDISLCFQGVAITFKGVINLPKFVKCRIYKFYDVGYIPSLLDATVFSV